MWGKVTGRSQVVSTTFSRVPAPRCLKGEMNAKKQFSYKTLSFSPQRKKWTVFRMNNVFVNSKQTEHVNAGKARGRSTPNAIKQAKLPHVVNNRIQYLTLSLPYSLLFGSFCCQKLSPSSYWIRVDQSSQSTDPFSISKRSTICLNISLLTPYFLRSTRLWSKFCFRCDRIECKKSFGLSHQIPELQVERC